MNRSQERDGAVVSQALSTLGERHAYLSSTHLWLAVQRARRRWSFTTLLAARAKPPPQPGLPCALPLHPFAGGKSRPGISTALPRHLPQLVSAPGPSRRVPGAHVGAAWHCVGVGRPIGANMSLLAVSGQRWSSGALEGDDARRALTTARRDLIGVRIGP